MTQLGFVLDANECTGCKACVVACKDVKNLPVGYKLRRVLTGEAGCWVEDAASGLLQPDGVFSYSISYACMHCGKPACLEACPKGAIAKDAATGAVLVDPSRCIGCGACARACPWDAPVVVPGIDGVGAMRKCDLCADLRALGEEPACVAACSMRCLKLADLADADLPQGLYDPLLASAPHLQPNMVLLPHRGLLEHPQAQVRLHSMPEEYAND